MRSFITRCSVGEVTTEGEGNGKKVSKKRAAEMMLEELKKLPDMPSATAKPKKPPVVKKKNRNLIKVSGPLVSMLRVALTDSAALYALSFYFVDILGQF